MEMTTIDQCNDRVSTKKMNFCNNIVDRKPKTFNFLEFLQNHVAWILVKDNGRVVSTGTFFLLTESLGLTCYHVVKDVLEFPCYRIMISFNYNSIEEERRYLLAEIEAYSEGYDFAFLRVTESPIPGGPGGLLQNLAPPTQHRAVFTIGNYRGLCKRIDYCSVINFNNREDLRPPTYSLVLKMYNIFEMFDPKNYRTYLNEGASGAPIINNKGELVAMHAGHYTDGSSATNNSLIEYGHSAVEIIIRGAVVIEDLRYQFFKLVESDEALRSYMSSGSHPPDVKTAITGLINLWKAEINQIHLRKIMTELGGSGQIDSTMEASNSARSVLSQDHPQSIPNTELRDGKEKDEYQRSPLKIRLEFRINNEDDLRNMEKAITRLLPRSLHCKKNDNHSASKKLGSYKCKSEKCKVCKFMEEGTTFFSYQTEKTYHICKFIDCSLSNVVYLMWCTLCELQYVGYTETALEKRIWKHISDASNPNSKTTSMVSKHFQAEHKGDLGHLRFQGIQLIKKPRTSQTVRRSLLNEEALWIWELNTIHPNGLNVKSGCVRNLF